MFFLFEKKSKNVFVNKRLLAYLNSRNTINLVLFHYQFRFICCWLTLFTKISLFNALDRFLYSFDFFTFILCKIIANHLGGKNMRKFPSFYSFIHKIYYCRFCGRRWQSQETLRKCRVAKFGKIFFALSR